MAKKKKNRIWLIIGILAFVGAAVLAGTLSKGGKKGTKVTVEKVGDRTIVETVGASGRIYPEVEVKISSDVSGEVIQLNVEEGDSVVAGQLLLKIQPEIYVSAVERADAAVNSSKAQLENSKAQISQVKAQIAQVQAQYDNAKVIFERQKKLLADGVISQADYDAAETSLKTAKANLASSNANLESALQSSKAAEFSVASAQASLKESRENLTRTSIYAPQSGVISRLNIEQGERIVGNQMMSGTELMRIANMRYMEVQVDVSENDVLRVNIGDEVEIEVDAYLDRIFKGKVTQIANSATEGAAGLTNDQITNFTVKIRVDPTSYKDILKGNTRKFPFRPGMSASVEIQTNVLNDVVSVPIQSVTTREEESDGENLKEADLKEVVFLYAADTVSMVEVKTGIQDDEYIQILEGLEKGVEVVTGPYSAISKKLENGKEVVVVEQDKLYDDKE